MATFGEYLRQEREKKDLNQSDFGQELGIIMTDISKIENGRKQFPFAKLEKLSTYLKVDLIKLTDLFVADKMVAEARKYACSEKVYAVAETQHKYLRSKNAKQTDLKFQ